MRLSSGISICEIILSMINDAGSKTVFGLNLLKNLITRIWNREHILSVLETIHVQYCRTFFLADNSNASISISLTEPIPQSRTCLN